MLAAKIEELNQLAEALHDAFSNASATIERHREEKEATQQEVWRLQRDLAALRRIEEDFDEVAEANRRYHKQRDQLRQGLERILNNAKALGLEYRE
jgi:uncharacterized coiled-coil DUF342 family protein